MQDEVVRTIVAILAAHVRRAETQRTRTKPPNSWQAYDYYLQAVDAMTSFDVSFSKEDLYETRRLLQHSLSIDANFARSYALLANTYGASWANALDGDFLNSETLDRAHQFARKAVQLDPSLYLAHASLGLALVFKHEHDASIAAFEKAMALNPNYVGWHFGAALVFAGEFRRAIDALEAYARLDPFAAPLGLMGLAHYMRRKYSQALAVLRDCVSRAPNIRPAHVWLAATYAQLGQLDEARAEAAEVLRLQPNFTIAGTARRLAAFKRPEDDRHFFDGLRKAGLPE